jgi:chaperone modulatory protein CbpM
MINRKTFTLVEASKLCGLDQTTLISYIKEEWISPQGASQEPTSELKLLLDEEDVARAYLIQELKKDFGVNPESISIILNLLDQLHGLRNQIHRLADEKK